MESQSRTDWTLTAGHQGSGKSSKMPAVAQEVANNARQGRPHSSAGHQLPSTQRASRLGRRLSEIAVFVSRRTDENGRMDPARLPDFNAGHAVRVQCPPLPAPRTQPRHATPRRGTGTVTDTDRQAVDAGENARPPATGDRVAMGVRALATRCRLVHGMACWCSGHATPWATTDVTETHKWGVSWYREEAHLGGERHGFGVVSFLAAGFSFNPALRIRDGTAAFERLAPVDLKMQCSEE